METIVISTDESVNPKTTSHANQIREYFPEGIKKIMYINPPDLDESKFSPELSRNHRYWNYPAYGLLTLSKISEEMGVSVEVLNLQNEILKTYYEDSSLKKAEYNNRV